MAQTAQSATEDVGVLRLRVNFASRNSHFAQDDSLRKRIILGSGLGSIMKKIFHFDSPAEQYVADAAVLCCFDYRINRAVRKFLKKQGIERVDMIVVAGGAKTLASPRNDFEQDFILEQVRMSIRLHKTERVLVMSHSDCATYGGLAQFKGDKAAEAEHHRGELLRAGELLTATLPRHFSRALLREVRRHLGSEKRGLPESGRKCTRGHNRLATPVSSAG